MIRKVKTENGWVRGLPAADPRITSYKGIPYAAPPVGANRWRAPQPCADWSGELNAFDFSPVPMQAPNVIDVKNIYSREWAVDPEQPMGEDCLTLNVWTPADGRTGMPVFVWYFGGGLQVGHTAEMEFDGERIARRGIVVVTVNYRVNAFGFLCHPEITAEAPDAPANFGFLDQQCATRWVKRNIAAFGGDPDRITIGGQSAGGMSVSAQLTCRANQGLFQRAIIQSGAIATPYPSGLGLTHSMAESEENGKRFFDFLGVKTLAEARAIDGMTLRDKMLDWENIHGWAKTWGETIDGVFSRRCSQDWFKDDDRIRCPILLGHTDSEFIAEPPATDEASLRALAEQLFGADAEGFLRHFDAPYTAAHIGEQGRMRIIEYAVRVAGQFNAAHASPAPLYYYCFATDIPGWDDPGTFHSVDLWFFFETLAKCWRPFAGRHYDLARQMCDYWCNFIRAGDPNGDGSNGAALPYWPTFTPDQPVRMVFADTSRPEQCPPSPLCRFLVDEAAKCE